MNLLPLVLLVLGCTLPPTPAAPVGPDPEIARLVEAHLQFLASDDLGGRETGTVQSLATGQYVAAAMREAGLEPAAGDGGFFQSYPLEANRLDAASARLTVMGASGPQEFKFGENWALRGYNSGGFDLTADCVFAGHGLVSEEAGLDEYAGLDVTNKFVVVLEGAPKGGEGFVQKSDDGKTPRRDPIRAASSGRAKRAAARSHGALGYVTIFDETAERARGSFKDLVAEAEHPALTIPPSAEDVQPAWPSLSMDSKAGRALLAAGGMDLDAERTARASFPTDPATQKPGAPAPGRALPGASLHLVAGVKSEKAHAYNILGRIQGSDPTVANETVILSAHNDHIGTLADGRVNNGADDNASGTTTLLVAAWELARQPAPRRSIVFLSVSGEEKGLWGSEWWCDHPTIPLTDVVCDINIDMVGRNDPDAVGATPSPAHEDYNSLVARAVELGPQSGLRVTWTAPAASEDLVDNYYTRSDHYNFAAKGIPVVFFFSGVHEDYHRTTDDVEKIDRAKITRMVDLVGRLATDTANAAGRPHKIAKG